MVQGTVKRFSPRNGYGFIAFDKDGKQESAFVHQKDIKLPGFRCLYPDEEVKFELEQNDQGYKAVNVHLVKEKEISYREFVACKLRTRRLEGQINALLDTLGDPNFTEDGAFLERKEVERIRRGDIEDESDLYDDDDPDGEDE